MANSFLLQGERLDLSVGGFTVPVASLTIFDAASVLLLVPLLDRIVFPLLDRWGLRPSLLKKIGQGRHWLVNTGRSTDLTQHRSDDKHDVAEEATSKDGPGPLEVFQISD